MIIMMVTWVEAIVWPLDRITAFGSFFLYLAHFQNSHLESCYVATKHQSFKLFVITLCFRITA